MRKESGLSTMSDRQEGMDFTSIEAEVEYGMVETLPPSLERNPTQESFYYADEASLYSIAENSNEWKDDEDKSSHPQFLDGNSPITEAANNTTAVTYHSQTSKEEGASKDSPPGNGTDGSQTTALRHNRTDLEHRTEVGVELCYATGDVEDRKRDVSPLEDEGVLYFPFRIAPTTYLRRRRRRSAPGQTTGRVMTVWSIVLLIGLICLSAALIMFQKSAQSRSSSIASVEGGDDAGRGKNETTNGFSSSAPTKAPVLVDSPTPQKDIKWILSENYVHGAVKMCQGTGTFFNKTTIQGTVFDLLVQEVYDAAISSTEDEEEASDVTFAALHTTNYLREKYSLNVLYLSTNGPSSWKDKSQWMTPTDPCNAQTAWFGVECSSSDATDVVSPSAVASGSSSCDASSRAITGLDLNDNRLSGTLPPELCCMPCIRSINMSNNAIGGEILWCIDEIATLEFISLDNNTFTSVGEDVPPAVDARSVEDP